MGTNRAFELTIIPLNPSDNVSLYKNAEMYLAKLFRADLD